MILSLETSGDVCSVAVHNDGALLWLEELQEKQAHASKLAVLIGKALNDDTISSGKLKAVAVSSGPGSYTGLRIGTSTAKGICYSLSTPLLSVGTLSIMAARAAKEFSNVSLCPMIDARRMEVYSMLLGADGSTVHPVEARVIDEYSYAQELEQGKIVFFGDGAVKCRDFIRHPNAVFAEGIFPSAKELGELASGKFANMEIEDLLHFEPFYLKEFVAKKPTKSLL